MLLVLVFVTRLVTTPVVNLVRPLVGAVVAMPVVLDANLSVRDVPVNVIRPAELSVRIAQDMPAFMQVH